MTDNHSPAESADAPYVHLDNVVYHLDDVEVDKDGNCKWTDVANALQHIKACVERRSQPGHANALPVWQELQLGMLLGKLSDWRNTDHEDSIAIGRSDIIAILDGFKALGRLA